MLLTAFYACASNSKITVESKICEKISGENVDSSLVLFIMEGSCSECINAEFQNIEKNREQISSLTVVGAFSNRRSFISCVNAITFDKPVKKVFIDISELEGVRIRAALFYFLYRDGTCSNVFYPQPCERDLTKRYYESLFSAKNVSP
jgi:hypothetical protein